MKRIFWVVMGEGLGHVTRTLAAIEHLRECEVHIFTSGKPMLAIPEPGQYEQYINAFYLEKVGAGRRCELPALSPQRVRDFADSAMPHAPRPASGAADVAKIIGGELLGSPAELESSGNGGQVFQPPAIQAG